MKALLVLPLALGAILSAQQREPKPAGTLVVRGIVIDQNGNPIAGAGVLVGPRDRISAQDALRRPLARSGEDGRFELRRARPIDRVDQFDQHDVIIAAKGRTTVMGWTLYSMFVAREEDHVLDLGEIVLAPGTRVEGRVRGKRGRPIAGARVRTVDLLSPGPYSDHGYATQAITDAKGRFVLEGACRSAMRIHVDAPGHYRRTIPFANSRDPFVVILERSGFIEGRVVVAGNGPVMVNVTYELHNAEQELATTDNEGRFRMTKRFPCRYVVVGGNAIKGQVGQSAWMQQPQTGIVVRVPQNPILIRAKDAKSGKAIMAFRGAVDWSEKVNEEMFAMMFSFMARHAESSGILRLRGPTSGESSTGFLRVAAEGYAPKTIMRLKHEETKKPNELVVALDHGSAVSGRIMDALGKPIASALVVCLDKPEWQDSEWYHVRASAKSDRDGRFRMTGLTEGKFVIVARRKGSHVESVAKIEVKGSADSKGVQMRIAQGLTISGKVTNLEKIRGARVLPVRAEKLVFPVGWRMRPFRRPGSPTSGAVAIGKDGAYRIEDCCTGKHELFLLLPVPPRTGSPLRIPIGTVFLRNKPVEVNVDARRVAPGVVAGKVRIKGPHIPHGRLALVFSETRGKRSFDVRLATTRWVLPASDGSYEVAVAPGKHYVSLVDLATGVRVHLESETIDVEAGKRIEKNLDARIVSVEVTLRPSGPFMAVDLLRVEIPTQTAQLGQWGFLPLLGVGTLGAAGVDLAMGQHEVSLLVPEGPVKLTAKPGCKSVDGLSISSAMGDLGTAEFDAIAGKPCEIKIEVARPPKLR